MTGFLLPNSPGSNPAATATTASGTATRNNEKHSASITTATGSQQDGTTVCQLPTIYVGSGGSNPRLEFERNGKFSLIANVNAFEHRRAGTFKSATHVAIFDLREVPRLAVPRTSPPSFICEPHRNEESNQDRPSHDRAKGAIGMPFAAISFLNSRGD